MEEKKTKSNYQEPTIRKASHKMRSQIHTQTTKFGKKEEDIKPKQNSKSTTDSRPLKYNPQKIQQEGNGLYRISKLNLTSRYLLLVTVID